MAKQVKSKYDKCWISDLPYVVLCRILSFLPTEEAVRTSILSTRWRYLFSEDDRRVNSFMNFVDRVLFFHKVTRIERFRLRCSHGVDSLVYGWISAALWHNLEELDLCISSNDEFISLPVGLFTCKMLVVLKLDSCLVLNVPSNVCFPSLKTIQYKGSSQAVLCLNLCFYTAAIAEI
ncbi:LOW QUALITY PROTEIN: FBD-associated F-box protein At4g10400-like [Durio zibethinus]|uniref:LOW QUALITY PROTEIN: FBD-associated F-box protein At4g10400-like n=1 Tax=Durio zibethinus TaxID=66656 RepID=A0A6P5ZGF7_DURZI|nr:LOW QUALITY PROTEIN: FBD-associated F-box protein At4g10400-like [Durio zibethinus]